MHRQVKQWMAAFAVAAAVLFGGATGVAAQGGGGGRGGGGGGRGGNAPADPPVVAYRKTMMQINQQHIAALRVALTGNAGSKEDIEMHAAALENQGKMWAGLFPAGSTGPTSRAKDEIWTNKDDFAAKVKAFVDATSALDEAAEHGDNAATMTALNAVQATCGGCHTPYRKPAEAGPR